MPPIARVAVLICTRERMEALSRCLASVSLLRVPEGVGLEIVVADNNPEPQEAAIRELGATYRMPLHYGHEPERGYSSVRNRAIEIALAAGADLLVFIDDDSTVLPGLVTEHIAAIERHKADVVVGSFEGLEHRAREGQRLTKAGTGNVALRRWLVDREAGADVRFDPRLNLIGFEDHEFFRDVTAAGGIIVRSARPLARDERSPGFASPAPSAPAHTPRTFAIMEGRNEIAAARIRHGWGVALVRFALRMTPQIARGTTAYAQSLLLRLKEPRRADELARRAGLHIAKVCAALGGFTGPAYDRPAAKAGRLIAVPGTARSRRG